MTESKQHVTIKGVKDGLVFLLDDTCEFDLLLAELRHKLEHSHSNILTGPIIHVTVKAGKRAIGSDEKDQILEVFSHKGNLLVQGIESDAAEPENEADKRGALTILKGIIRSGQTLAHDGNVLYLGDVNPGGAILCTGDIYVLGAIRGMAHAGTGGNERAIIAASYLRPTQLRIADVISRPPDEWGIEDASMEFAYITNGKMEISKISQLHRLRPEHPYTF